VRGTFAGQHHASSPLDCLQTDALALGRAGDGPSRALVRRVQPNVREAMTGLRIVEFAARRLPSVGRLLNPAAWRAAAFFILYCDDLKLWS